MILINQLPVTTPVTWPVTFGAVFGSMTGLRNVCQTAAENQLQFYICRIHLLIFEVIRLQQYMRCKFHAYKGKHYLNWCKS